MGYAFFWGFLIGHVMNIPVGPINCLVISQAVRRRMGDAMGTAMGGSLMDGLYFFIFLSGLTLIDLPVVEKKLLSFVGGGVLLCLSIFEWRHAKKSDIIEDVKTTMTSVGRSFLLGVGLYLSNPTVIITLSTLSVAIRGAGFVDLSTPSSRIFFSVGAFLGGVGWFATLLFLVSFFRTRFTKNFLPRLHQLSAIILFLLGMSVWLKSFHSSL